MAGVVTPSAARWPAGILIAMKFALLRHSPKALRQAGWVIGGLLAVGSWAVVVLAAGSQVRAEVTMLVLACWAAGALLGPVSMSGSGVLRPDYFTLLPLDRRRLALGLLLSAFPGVASGLLLLALLTVAGHAAGLAPELIPVAIVAAVLAWIVTITAARLVFVALGAAMRSRLGVEIAAVQYGFMIAGFIVGWMIVVQAFQTVPQLVQNGVGDARVVRVLSWLPSSWPVRAVDAAAAGDITATAGWLLLLAVTAAVLLLIATLSLRPNVDGASTRRSRRSRSGRLLVGRSWWPDGALAAVLAKELVQWWSDPWRRLEVRTAFWTALAIGLICSFAADFRAAAPLSGLVIAFMICLAGCNLYGQDGSAVWLTVVGERADTIRADVRGRQLAMVITFAPLALVVSVLIMFVTGAGYVWPIVAAALPALVGVAVGVAVLISAVGVSPGVDPRRRVGPNDAGGNLGVQAQLAFWSTTALVLPTVGAIVLGLLVIGGAPGVLLAIGAGLLNGVAGYWLLGRAAIGYLRPRLPTVFTQIRYGFRDDDAGGTLGWVAKTSQEGEEKARAAKAAERVGRGPSTRTLRSGVGDEEEEAGLERSRRASSSRKRTAQR